MQPPEENSYLTAARRAIWRPPEEKSYLTATRRAIWRPPEEKSYLTAARRVKWRPPEEESYLAAADLFEKKKTNVKKASNMSEIYKMSNIKMNKFINWLTTMYHR